MSMSTLRWTVRAVGAAMLIFFAYLFCSMQDRLMRMRQEQQLGGSEVRREASPDGPPAPPAPAGTTAPTPPE